MFPFKPCVLIVYCEEDDSEEEVTINYRISTKQPEQRVLSTTSPTYRKVLL